MHAKLHNYTIREPQNCIKMIRTMIILKQSLQISCPGHGRGSGETIQSTGSTAALISSMPADPKCWTERERDNVSALARYYLGGGTVLGQLRP